MRVAIKRISALPGDPGFIASGDRGRFDIYLNDVKQTDVVTADVDKGFVIRLKVDPKTGAPDVIDDQWLCEQLKGKVRIRERRK